jgi:mannosyltransferase
MSRPQPRALHARTLLLPLVPLGLAAALGFYALGAKSMTFDEAFSVGLARLDWPAMWRVISTKEANMALYYGLLHYWLALGRDEFTVRALSALLAVAAVLALYAVGQRLLGPRGALLASTLLAMHAFFVRYAQEARSYSLLLLLTTASTLLFVRALEQPSAKAWAGYITVTALAPYTQFVAVWVVAAQCLAAMLPRRARPVPRRQVLVAQAAVALLASPLLAWTLTTERRLGWLAPPNVHLGLEILRSLTGYGGPLQAVVYLGLSGAALLTAWAARRKPGGGEVLWSRLLLLAWLLVPILASFAFSYLVTPVFNPRYLIVSLPPLVLLVAAGALSLRSAPLRAGALLVVFALAAWGLVRWYTGFPKDDWRGVTKYILAQAEPGDGVVFDQPRTRVSFEYYLYALRERGAARVARLEPVFPSAPWGAYDDLSPEVEETSGGWLRGHPIQQRRVWLVRRGHSAWEPPDWVVRDSPGARYCRLRDRRFRVSPWSGGRLGVELYGVCGAEPGRVTARWRRERRGRRGRSKALSP